MNGTRSFGMPLGVHIRGVRKSSQSTGNSLLVNPQCQIFMAKPEGQSVKKDEDGLVWASHSKSWGHRKSSIQQLVPTDFQRPKADALSAVCTRRGLSFVPADPLGMLMCILTFDTNFEIIPGVPRTPKRDDVYEGYFLPKGTWTMPTIRLVIALYLSHNSNTSLGDASRRICGDRNRIRDLPLTIETVRIERHKISVGEHFSIAFSTLATCDILRSR